MEANFQKPQIRGIISITLEQVWVTEKETVYLGYCPKCGRLNVKAKVIGHFDNWTIECVGCHRMNGISDLRFKTQTRA